MTLEVRGTGGMFPRLTTLTAEVVAWPSVSRAGVKCCIMLTDCDIFLFVYLLERIEIWRGGSQVWRESEYQFHNIEIPCRAGAGFVYLH